MAQKITVKTRFNASKQLLEQYGPGKYLVYLPFPEDAGAKTVISAMLSRKIGVPPHRIMFLEIDSRKDWIFESS